MRGLLLEQQNLLERLQAQASDRQQTPWEIGRAEAQIVQRGNTARTELTRLLYWPPSPPLPPERRLVADLSPSIAWLSSSAQRRATAAALLEGVRRMSLRAGGPLLLAVLLLALRPHLRHRRFRC